DDRAALAQPGHPGRVLAAHHRRLERATAQGHAEAPGRRRAAERLGARRHLRGSEANAGRGANQWHVRSKPTSTAQAATAKTPNWRGSSSASNASRKNAARSRTTSLTF